MSSSKAENRDELALLLQKTINDKYKKTGKVAFFLGGQDDAATEVKEWISTGSSTLDIAISNKPNGGFPIGKIIEITGLEASGKSLLASHAIAETQKKGGMGIYFDTESAMNEEFMTAIGVDLKKMLYLQMSALEDIFETIEEYIKKIRESHKDRLVTIVVDSVMGASTRNELEGNYDKEGWATDKAIIISKAMRKLTDLIARERILLIFTNQLRDKLGATFGEKYTTSGGKALAFHASVRLRMNKVRQLKKGATTHIIGIKTNVKVQKNRVGPPFRQAEFDIYFDRGIDDYSSWLGFLSEHDVIKQSGAWYSYTSDTGKEFKFQSKEFEAKVITDTEVKTELYNKICSTIIMQYRTHDLGIDDVVVGDDVTED